MAARLACVLVLITAMAMAVSACGGDDSSSLSAESQAAVTQIERICDDASAKARETQGEFPVADFDPENPSPTDLPVVGNYFSTGHSIWDDAFKEARGLTVPNEIEAQVDALLDAVESDLALAKQQAEAAKDADVAGFTATFDDVEASRTVINEAADELGVSCDY